MPSSLHEVLVELFRERPELALELIDVDGGVPTYDELQFDDPTFNPIAPAEYRADAVITLRRVGHARPVLALILEVQLRTNDNKRYAWPVYLATLRARLRCPAAIVVVTPKRSVARWAAQAIALGMGSAVQPLVIGPDAVPKVTTRAEASEAPQLAVLSPLAHARDANAATVAAAALAGVDARLGDGTLDDSGARLYCDLILHAVGPATAAEVETMIRDTNDYKSEFARRYFGQGVAQGSTATRSALLLRLMTKRGLQPSEQHIAQVEACNDTARLERWFDRAVVALSADEVFEDDA